MREESGFTAVKPKPESSARPVICFAERHRARTIAATPVWLLALLVSASEAPRSVSSRLDEGYGSFSGDHGRCRRRIGVFMAGLGVAALFWESARTALDPLRYYGALELAIALSVSISPWLVDLVRAIYYRLGGQESLGATGATLVRLMLAAAIMAVPTFLMGGTLPAAVRSVTRTADVKRRTLGSSWR
jgi:hypothetical protein